MGYLYMGILIIMCIDAFILIFIDKGQVKSNFIAIVLAVGFLYLGSCMK